VGVKSKVEAHALSFHARLSWIHLRHSRWDNAFQLPLPQRAMKRWGCIRYFLLFQNRKSSMILHIRKVLDGMTSQNEQGVLYMQGD
jgi:hypothetical protein